MKFFVIIIICGLLSFFIIITAFNTIILRTNCLKPLRVLVQMFAPPRDIFNYSVKEKIDISKKTFAGKYKYINKYLGKYSVGILLDNFSNKLYFEKKHNLKLVMTIKFYLKNNLFLSFITKGEYYPFIARDGSGFILMTYKCPEDLPINNPIECEIQIVEPDGDLNNAYGSAKFYIKKMSDE